MMRFNVQIGMWLVLGAFMLGGVSLRAERATLTGTVGDAMCGAKHMMAGDEASCTQACVKKGSDYALIVKDKAYTLKASDAMKTELAKLAGRAARVTGDQDGDIIQVTAVQAAK